MKLSCIVLSIASLVASQQVAAAGLQDNLEERALQGEQQYYHRRHHARATTSTTLALSRRPLVSSTSTTSKAASTSTQSTSTSKASTTTSKASSSTSSSAASSTSTTINLKKGISYNSINNTVPFQGKVGWAYDWFSASDGNLPSGIEFQPMLWSGLDNYLTSIWAAYVQAAIKSGSTHLLGFNEPDLKGQADMTIDQAVTAWRKYMDPYAGQIKLVAPAITNGGAPSGVTWMQNFLTACTGCHIDAIAMHWYDQAWNTGYFTNYFSDAVKAFSPRPIWITEFRGSGIAAEQVTFIKTVVPWMNKQAGIERYAIFGNYDGKADEGNMITGGKLNAVGIAYRDAV